MKFLAIIPLVLSIAAFVLVTLATFAGRKPGFMEDYAVVRLNMSGFGQDVIANLAGDDQDSNEDDGEDDDSIFDKLGDFADDAIDKVTDEINDIANSAADKLADAIGFSEWYSLHLMDSCEGAFEPNATSPGPSLNVTNCTDPTVGYKINLTEIIDREIDLGPLDLNLADDLKFPDGIQRQVARINRLLMAVTIFFLLAMGFSGLCIFVAVGDLLVGDRKRSPAFVGIVVGGLGSLSLLIGAAITTAAATSGAETITDIGENVGIYAEKGQKFIIITWVAFALMFVATLLWTVSMCQHRRKKRASSPADGEKPRRGLLGWRY